MEQFDRERQGDLSAAQRDCADASCVIARAGGKGWTGPLPARDRTGPARDVSMAKTVTDHPDSVVLLAGNGHVRRDIGVGRWLRAVGARSEAYLERGAKNTPAYDVVHWVAPHVRADPCASMGKISPARTLP